THDTQLKVWVLWKRSTGRRVSNLSLVMNDRGEKVILIGHRRTRDRGQSECVLALFKLNRNVSGYDRPVGSVCVGIDLRLPNRLTVEPNRDSNHCVHSLRPNRSVAFQIHGLVADSVEGSRYR